MKTHDHDNAHAAQHRAVAQQTEHGEAATQLVQAGPGTFDHRVNHSPRMAAQRQLLGAAFGPALQQPIQREAGLDDEEPAVQAKQEAPTEANLTGMPNQLKSGVEALSGMDMSDVRVHRNSGKPAQLNALAYAQGNEIHLGPGQEQHLPHEAWHVVQQRQGRVQATMQMAGMGVNDDAGLESEADLMGEKAEVGLAHLVGDGKRQDPTPKPLYRAAQLAPSGSVAAAQRRLIEAIDGSPRVTAQRQAIAGMGLQAKTVQRFDPEKEKEHLGEQAGRWRIPFFWHSDNKIRRDEVLKQILKEAYTLLESNSVKLESVTDEGSGMTPRGVRLEDRHYRIKIDDTSPWGNGNDEFDATENRIRSVILHELIHVAADQTYQINQNENSVDRAFNVDSREEMSDVQEDDRIYKEIDRIDLLVDDDTAILDDEKEYVKFRINRAREWSRELDTVMSELVYYFDLQNISASSVTSIAITALAAERHQRRSRHEGPIARKDREVTEGIKKELWNQALHHVGSSEAIAYLQ